MQRLNERTPHPAGSTDAASCTTLLPVVESAIRNSPAIDAFEVTVTVIGNTVRLDGTVGSYAERTLAEGLASGVAGVGEVTNDITVRPFGTDWAIGDDQIAASIQAALSELQTSVEAAAVTYNVYCHVVTLKGTARSVADRALVRHTIETLPGVDFVENNIEVLT